jgi:hypothetical protein
MDGFQALQNTKGSGNGATAGVFKELPQIFVRDGSPSPDPSYRNSPGVDRLDPRPPAKGPVGALGSAVARPRGRFDEAVVDTCPQVRRWANRPASTEDSYAQMHRAHTPLSFGKRKIWLPYTMRAQGRQEFSLVLATRAKGHASLGSVVTHMKQCSPYGMFCGSAAWSARQTVVLRVCRCGNLSLPKVPSASKWTACAAHRGCPPEAAARWARFPTALKC